MDLTGAQMLRQCALPGSATNPRGSIARVTEDLTQASHHVRMLLAVRQKHHWSQQRLAVELGVSRRTIVNWEKEHKQPPLFVLGTLRELLLRDPDGAEAV